MPPIDLELQLLDVAVLRATAQQAKDKLAAERAAFEAAHAGLIGAIQTLTAALEEAESRARATALAHYAATGETRPVPGLEVKVFKALDYDPAAALAWARAHPDKDLLALDARTYEKRIKLARSHDLPDWRDAPGEVGDEPRVQIARDLVPFFGAPRVARAAAEALADVMDAYLDDPFEELDA